MAKELEDLIQRINKAVRSDKAMRTALTSVMAIHKPRVFESGQDANGGKIGSYSTNPISISRSKQARDTGHTVFKGGYAQYKRETGKGDTVNFVDRGQMQADYQIIASGEQYAFGFQNEENWNKSQWLQDKYDKDVFDLTDRELELLGDVHKAEVEKLL